MGWLAGLGGRRPRTCPALDVLRLAGYVDHCCRLSRRSHLHRPDREAVTSALRLYQRGRGRRLKSPGRDEPTKVGQRLGLCNTPLRCPSPCPAVLTAGSPTGVPSAEAASGVALPAG